MGNVYLAASVRTPIGRFGGTLASWTAADLGVAVAKESLERAHLRPEQIQQSIWDDFMSILSFKSRHPEQSEGSQSMTRFFGCASE